MTENKNTKLLHCHFCEKSQDQVKTLIAGKYSHICNECIVECVAILAEVDLHEGDSQ